jgi:anti-sigma B factor antagonist
VELTQRRYADVVILALSGRVDHGNAEAFKAALWPHLAACAEDGDRLVLDLSGLEYISSAGLRILMLAARDVRERSGTLVVCGLQPVVSEIFGISRFDAVFRVYLGVRAALADLSPRAAAAYAGA